MHWNSSELFTVRIVNDITSTKRLKNHLVLKLLKLRKLSLVNNQFHSLKNLVLNVFVWYQLMNGFNSYVSNITKRQLSFKASNCASKYKPWYSLIVKERDLKFRKLYWSQKQNLIVSLIYFLITWCYERNN